MTTDPVISKRNAQQLLEQLDPVQLAAVVKLLEVMTYEGDDDVTEEDRDAIIASRDYFKSNPDGGVSFAQVVSDCGFTINQIRRGKAE